ncbi:3'-5' exonuclease [Marinospirillum sp.]|uniref:3'-5' exonuclease n=1 Tax=Marinospirillum sp. TaxID=2183934 RepID=UPI003A884AA4
MFYLDPQKLRDPQASTLDVPQDWPAFYQQAAQEARDPRLRAFYQAGVVAADTPIHQVPLLALDFETTGMHPRKHSIVSIGLIPFHTQRIFCAQARHWIVKPLSDLNPESVVLHGITHADVQQAPDLDRILEDVLQACAGHLVVVHHRGIERPFLAEALKARIQETLLFPMIDTMELEARWHRPPQRWWSRWWRSQPVSIRLADSRARYGLPRYRAHHALTDALATAELFQAQIAHHLDADTPVSALWG